MALRWYVVHAYSNFEHRVAESLKDRIKRDGLEAKFGEILVPTEEVVEMREGQKRKSERKFYPGYVLVQMEMDETTWHLVRDVPKVLGFIGGTSDKPAPISEKEANRILRPRCGRRRQAAAEGAVRSRAGGARDARPVQRFQRRGRERELREEPAAGGRADSRPLDTRRAGFLSGRKGLRVLFPGECPVTNGEFRQRTFAPRSRKWRRKYKAT